MTDVGLLPRGALARRMSRETFLLLGGPAATLLQVAHPLVAAGVAAHSSYRRDPLGRLVRTVDLSLAGLFGTTRQARGALAQINRRHIPVHGVAPNGHRYDARDPRLVMWVETTLALTSIRLYELVMGRLKDDERETFWGEALFFARELGATARVMPRTFGDALRYEREMLATEVVPDANAVAVARSVLRPFRSVPALVYWASDAFTAGLLPPSLRFAFGMPWRTRERVFYRAVIITLRFVVPWLPERIRLVPHARAYEARVVTHP